MVKRSESDQRLGTLGFVSRVLVQVSAGGKRGEALEMDCTFECPYNFSLAPRLNLRGEAECD